MEKIFWILTLIGAFLGSAYLIFGLTLENSAPQEAAIAATAIAFGALPYMISRALEGLNKKKVG